MGRVITFGEIMLRLSPPDYLRLGQGATLSCSYGGAESNVALSLSEFGLEAAFVSKLPYTPIAEGALRTLRGWGVDVAHVARGGKRMGIYFLEKGASVRPSLCVYDREGSSIQTASQADFDWQRIFRGADWFHFTGITPALGGHLADICDDACKTAKQMGLTVSCDLNYRGKLWTKQQAHATMGKLCRHVDVCVCNEEDAADVFGIAAEDSDIHAGKLSKSAYRAVAEKLSDLFGFTHVGITLRSSYSASDNAWAGMLYTQGKAFFSKEYRLHLVDRVGGGDSFGAGLIYSIISGMDSDRSINFAVAASALKQTIEGDFNRISVSEVEHLMKNGGAGRISR